MQLQPEESTHLAKSVENNVGIVASILLRVHLTKSILASNNDVPESNNNGLKQH